MALLLKKYLILCRNRLTAAAVLLPQQALRLSLSAGFLTESLYNGAGKLIRTGGRLHTAGVSRKQLCYFLCVFSLYKL